MNGSVTVNLQHFGPLWLLGVTLFLLPLPFVVRELPRPRSVSNLGLHKRRVSRLRDCFIPLPVIALAYGIRLYHYKNISMSLYEGDTVYVARLPWRTVLGLEGAYSAHPPLYFVAVKLVTLAVPEVAAGRLLSVVAGTLTVAVLYGLVTRLVNRPAALSASLVLAVSPLHVWYSQEARMYAPAMLLVAVSYLALVAFYQEGASQWVGAYAVALLLAMSVDYSALNALVPQVFLLSLVVEKYGRRSFVLFGVVLGAVVCFVSWIYQAAVTIGELGHERSFLLVSVPKVVYSLLAIAGLSGQPSYYWGDAPTPWATQPDLQGTFLLPVTLIVLLGIIALVLRFRLALAVAIMLVAGTTGTATLLSLVSPGYADRTVIYAILGWAILAGSAPFARVPCGGRLLAFFNLACVITLSLVTIGAI